MNNTHTPAPWETSTNYAGEWDVCEADGGDMIADLSQCGDAKTKEANAHLISAAPDLLSALEKAVNHKNAFWNNPDALDAALFAIRKAKGEA